MGNKLWGHQEHLRAKVLGSPVPRSGVSKICWGPLERDVTHPGSRTPTLPHLSYHGPLPRKAQTVPTSTRSLALPLPEHERALLRCLGVKLEAGPPRKPPGWKSPLL